MHSLEHYQYQLPAELIAQVPAKRRDRARMLVLNRAKASFAHKKVSTLVDYLEAGDVVVLNDTQVVPARLLGQKESGGRVELLLMHPASEQGPYRCLLRSSRTMKPGAILHFAEGIKARVCEQVDRGQTQVEFLDERPLLQVLDRVGSIPLPPYIRRNGGPVEVDDASGYQTVYAQKPGAVAAPTAGLHFTETLLESLRQKGVIVSSLTLHVGFGTFQPVREKDIRNHRIHQEFFEIPTETAQTINSAKDQGAKVVAIGTTAVRALEFSARGGKVQPGNGWCDLLIYPGYSFQIIDGLLTNFHLPGSSLIMLVSAWAGRNLLLKAYDEAIRKRYRFYSYGDAMYIE